MISSFHVVRDRLLLSDAKFVPFHPLLLEVLLALQLKLLFFLYCHFPSLRANDRRLHFGVVCCVPLLDQVYVLLDAILLLSGGLMVLALFLDNALHPRNYLPAGVR